jgi:hypothetical protein
MAKASANHGAKVANRMQEYPVSICFLERTAPCVLYSVFMGETQMKSPRKRAENRPFVGAKATGIG